MFKMRKRNQNDNYWLDELDDESKQETVIKYLRSLDNKSLKKLYEAVDLFRQGDDKLKKVVEPEPESEEKSEDENEDEL